MKTNNLTKAQDDMLTEAGKVSIGCLLEMIEELDDALTEANEKIGRLEVELDR